ncbi:hypothetical protein V8F20_008891 [Naviculisporaceae sp. PSN 640]
MSPQSNTGYPTSNSKANLPMCPNGPGCRTPACGFKFNHPRADSCQDGKNCSKPGCQLFHPKAAFCDKGPSCPMVGCQKAHPWPRDSSTPSAPSVRSYAPTDRSFGSSFAGSPSQSVSEISSISGSGSQRSVSSLSNIGGSQLSEDNTNPPSINSTVEAVKPTKHPIPGHQDDTTTSDSSDAFSSGLSIAVIARIWVGAGVLAILVLRVGLVGYYFYNRGKKVEASRNG